MKKWLLNIGIKARHRLMIIISVVGIVIVGFAGYYFYQTSRVLNIIINAERIHNINFHQSQQLFYAYIHSGDSTLIEEGLARLDSANYLAETFGYTKKSFETKSKEDYIRFLFTAVPEAFDYKIKNARLMTNRVKLLVRIKNKAVFKSFEIAAQGAVIGKKIKQNMIDYISNPTENNLDIIRQSNLEMSDFFKDFAGIIYDLNSITKRFLLFGMLFSVIVLGALIYFLSDLISGTISDPVLKMRDLFKRLSKGDISEKITINSQDEVAELGMAFNTLVDNLDQITNQANIISTGDYSNDLVPRSEVDVLGKAIQQMTVSLREMSHQNELENWKKNGINQLNDIMRGDQDVTELSRKVVSFLSKYIEANMGVIYLYDKEDQVLRLSASYAFRKRKSMNSSYKIGEGLVGQAALEKETIVVSEVPEDYLLVESGLGNARPTNLMIVPVLFEDEVVAVIELATIHRFTDTQNEFLDRVIENIGIAINTSYARTEMKKLLIKTQEQAEELMTQQEELRQTNEELEEQTKALKDSEQQLQQQQEELRVTNEELEERTKAIEKQRDDIVRQNEELEQARHEIEIKANDLELASKYKSEFLANMSHELRTPLNSILVLSQILSQNKKGNLSDKQVQSAKTIYSSGNSLLSLINDVLDLSKVESGKLELNIEDMRIEDFKNEINETFLPLAHNKSLSFEIEVGNDVPAVIQTDQMRLQQIIRNLLSNAIKFTQNGSVTLEIFKATDERKYYGDKLKDQDVIGFAVKDTGIGIPKEKQQIIFEAFKQADGTTTRRYGGTGLGLSISKNFASLMGGEIHVESEQDQGTAFTLFIPLNPVEQANTSKQQSTDAPEKKKTEKNQEGKINGHEPKLAPEEIPHVKDDRKNINKGDKFILIIEDDRDFSQILYDLAHERGFKCMIAPNGESGLHYADYYKPDAIILDIGLPGIDGWEVMDRLKDNPETRHIPVHFMSGKDKSLEAMKMGAIGFLKKPVGLEVLNEAFSNIENIISKPLKKVLVVEDDQTMRNSIEELIGAQDVITTSVPNGQQALEQLNSNSFDCMILDLGLKDMSGQELLQKIGKNGKYANMPVIIYTGKDLTREEEENLQKYSERIIIKGARSPERLLAETTLFLHKIESELPEEKRNMLKEVHTKEDIMKDKRILIVDDDMRNVFALTSLLEDRGLRIDVGRNGKEGFDKIKAKKNYDLVLMDIMMPKMNGYEAMELIRKEPDFKKLPIIALTAKAMQGDREKCIKAGANDYLTKPIDPDKLISLLKVWLYNNN